MPTDSTLPLQSAPQLDPGEHLDITELTPTLATGRSNLLHHYSATLKDITQTLQDLAQQAPTLISSLGMRLERQLLIDPKLCGIAQQDQSMSLLDLAARAMSSPVFGTPFTAWNTWGLPTTSRQAKWTGRDWIHYFNGLPLRGTLSTARNAYWDARMPGQPVSRLAYGEQLLRQHYSDSLELAYGLDFIGRSAWEQGQTDRTGITYASINWEHPTQAGQTSSVALLIRPSTGRARWLLYRPNANQPVRAFSDETALRTWLFDHRSQLWPHPSTPFGSQDTSARITFSDLAGDGFSYLILHMLQDHQRVAETLLDQACQDATGTALDWSEILKWEEGRKNRFGKELPADTLEKIKDQAAADSALVEEEVHFDALNSRLPIHWRQQRVERQALDLRTYLGNDSAPGSARFEPLKQTETSLQTCAQDMAQMFADLPDAFDQQDMGKKHGELSRFELISDRLARGMLAEAQQQHALGQLSGEQLKWVEQVVERPAPSYLRPVSVSALSLSAGVHDYPLLGYLVLQAVPEASDETPATSVLLYKSGSNGGLKSFRDLRALEQALLATARGYWPEAILESCGLAADTGLLQALQQPETQLSIVATPIATHCFDYCTQTQCATYFTQRQASVKAHHEWLKAALVVPLNTARSLAFERIAEQNRSTHALNLLTPLKRLTKPQIDTLVQCLENYRLAAGAAMSLLYQTLPDRAVFTRQKLQARLRQDFSLEQVPDILIDLPDRVETRQETIEGSGQPYATKTTYLPSTARSEVALEQFLLWAIDEQTRLRLSYASFKFTGPEASPTLRNGMTIDYVKQLDTALDLAGAYETLIYSAFKGKSDETGFRREWRREVLCAPYQYSLQLLSLSKPLALNSAGQALLERFYQEQISSTPEQSISYQPLTLRPGVAADGSTSATTLSGIFIIQALSGGPALLLTPDAPDGNKIRQFADAQLACRDLEALAVNLDMRTYLARSPLDGKSDEHLSYINQAILTKASGFIGLGPTRHQTLFQHQSDLAMGELITIHRRSSRSQADWSFQRDAASHARIFNYIKMAIGFVPVVGTAISLYDGWNAANAAVLAFLSSRYAEGIEHMNSVVLSLIDAMMDIVPAATAGNAAMALARTRARQVASQIGTPWLSQRKRPSPFANYETEPPIGPWRRLEAGKERGLHEHLDSRSLWFLHDGKSYPVEWDASYGTWRLKSNDVKSYKMPVRLSDTGVWEPHGGYFVQGGLPAGGGIVTRLYNQGWESLRTYWQRNPPSPIDTLHNIAAREQSLINRLNEALSELNRLESLRTASVSQAPDMHWHQAFVTAKARTIEVIELAEQTLPLLENLRGQVAPRALKEQRHALNKRILRQNFSLLKMQKKQLTGQYAQSEQLHAKFEDLIAQLENNADVAADTIATYLDQLQTTRDIVSSLMELQGSISRYQRYHNRLQGQALTDLVQDMDSLQLPLDPFSYQLEALGERTRLLFKINVGAPDNVADFIEDVRRALIDFRETLSSHAQLAQSGLSRSQERRFLAHLRERYTQFITQTHAWQDLYPNRIEGDIIQDIREQMANIIGKVDQQLTTTTRPDRPARGPSSPRLFEIDDQHMVIGREATRNGQPMLEVSSSTNAQVHSSYSKNEQGQWQSNRPRVVSTPNLQQLETSSRTLLNGVEASKSKLSNYQRLNMTPTSLQDLADAYASPLAQRASALRTAAGNAISPEQTQLLKDLDTAWNELTALGRTLRIEQTKAYALPEVGHLQYLLGEKEVKIQWSRELEPARNANGVAIEYLEEYKIIDTQTQTPLWYAHFHFKKKPGQRFDRLEAGHIKLAAERNQAEGAWRGPIGERLANSLFAGLRP